MEQSPEILQQYNAQTSAAELCPEADSCEKETTSMQEEMQTSARSAEPIPTPGENAEIPVDPYMHNGAFTPFYSAPTQVTYVQPYPYRGQNPMIPPNPYTQADSHRGQSPLIPPNPYAQADSYRGQNPVIPPNPYAQQPYYTQTYGYSRVPLVTQQESKKGIVSIICGILSMLLCYVVPAVSLPLGIIAVVFGISKIKEAKTLGRGKAVGVLGLIFGILGSVATVALTTWLLVRFFDAFGELSQLGDHKPM